MKYPRLSEFLSKLKELGVTPTAKYYDHPGYVKLEFMFFDFPTTIPGYLGKMDRDAYLTLQEKINKLVDEYEDLFVQGKIYLPDYKGTSVVYGGWTIRLKKE